MVGQPGAALSAALRQREPESNSQLAEQEAACERSNERASELYFAHTSTTGSRDIQSVFFLASQSHHKYIKKKSFSGEVKDSVNSPIFFNLISFIKLYSPI